MRRMLATSAAVVVILGAGTVWATRTPTPSVGETSPSPTISPTPIPTPIAIQSPGPGLEAPMHYVFETFEPNVAVRFYPQSRSESPPTNDFCPAHESAGSIVIPWKEGCVSDIRIIQPFAVDCGTPDRHPDAATLGAAMLERLGDFDTTDCGSIGGSDGRFGRLFDGEFDGTGRVFQIRGHDFDASRVNPNDCLLCPTPIVTIRSSRFGWT